MLSTERHKHINSLQSTVTSSAVCTALFIHATETHFPSHSLPIKVCMLASLPIFMSLPSTYASQILSIAYKRFCQMNVAQPLINF